MGKVRGVRHEAGGVRGTMFEVRGERGKGVRSGELKVGMEEARGVELFILENSECQSEFSR
jgi:hypothetical protein